MSDWGVYVDIYAQNNMAIYKYDDIQMPGKVVSTICPNLEISALQKSSKESSITIRRINV